MSESYLTQDFREEVRAAILRELELRGGSCEVSVLFDAVRGSHDWNSLTVKRGMWDVVLHRKEVEFISPTEVRLVKEEA